MNLSDTIIKMIDYAIVVTVLMVTIIYTTVYTLDKIFPNIEFEHVTFEQQDQPGQECYQNFKYNTSQRYQTHNKFRAHIHISSCTQCSSMCMQCDYLCPQCEYTCSLCMK